MQSWFTFDPKLAERFQDMFVTMAGLGTAPRRRQEEMMPTDAGEPPATATASSAQPRPDAGRGQGDPRIQRQPAAVAAVDARAARRRPSGAGVAGFPRQRSVDGADAAISAANSDTIPMPGRWAATPAACRGCRSALRDRLAAIHAATGRKVSIVGWSLGGVYARDLALQAPDMVRSVDHARAVRSRATCGRPMRRRLYEAMSGESGGG